MSFKLTRECHEPKHYSAKITSKKSGAVIFLFEFGERPAAKAFYRKSIKPAAFHTFRTVEQRAKWTHEWLGNVDAWADRQAEARGKRKSFRHTLKVGDVLYTSWGYDQTNIEFFEVVRLVGDCMVEVMEIGQKSEATGFMQGKCTPDRGQYIGTVRRHRVLEGNSLDIHHANFGRATPYEQIEVVPGVKVEPALHWSATH